MPLAVKNLVIQDEDGDLIEGATVTVRRDVQGQPIAPLFSDRAGTIPLSNPFVAPTGKVSFFTYGGAYKVTIVKDDFSDEQRYEPIGLAAESDFTFVSPRGAWSGIVEYATGDLVTHTGDDGLVAFISLQDGNLNHEPDADTPANDAYWMISPGLTTEYAEAVLADAEAAAEAAEEAETNAEAAAALALTAVNPALRYTFDTGTSGAGVASGEFRGNNATLASWTAMYLNDSAAQGDVSAFLNSIFGGSSPTKGHIVGIHPQDATKFFIFAVTSVTDQSGRVDFAGSIVSSAGPFTDAWMFTLNFTRTGDQGAGDLTAANNLSDLANKPTALHNIGGLGQGKHTIWVPAAAMVPRLTNGAAPGMVEMSTNKNMFRTLDFDTTTQEFAQFEIGMPKSWNESTVTFEPVWSHPSTTTNFGTVFSLAGVARSNDDAGDVAFGTVQTSTDTGGTTNDIYVGPESSAITIAGTPAAGDVVQFQIARVPSDGSDTMAVDARLHGIRLFVTLDAATDA